MKVRMAWMFAVAALIGATVVRGDDLAPKAREILKGNQNAVVTVTALSKLDMSGTGLPIQIGGLGEAQETSCAGVVIDATGLTVVSYTALNPMEKFSSAIKIKMGGDEGGDGKELKSKTELSRIQMRLADGTEVAGRVVFKDKELDLAFLVPDLKEGDKAPAFSPVKLAGSVTAKELDDVVMVTRHEKNLGCQPIVDTARVTSVITKPRPLYDLSGGGRPGTAVFLPDGQLLGVIVAIGGEGEGMMGMGKMEALVLPSSEISKLAAQAKEAAAKKSKEETK